MNDYEISVVTPFHNVDMRYFDGAIKSMLAQTIGFEKIQWIVVVHNCEPQYLPLLKERLGQYPNVILTELNNDAKTPSSPRNHGVRLATAPYVGYLDGDDSYHPTCLAECVRNARETDSQVVCFRRDYELESESLVPLSEIVLWNQLKRRIVIEHGNWDMRRMFSGIWAFVTSKVFEREFLLRHRIEFDEEIPYCEDAMYSMCTLAQARRICYLPQLIGYHYFINGGSLVQNQSKTSKALVAYAHGMAKIVRKAYDFGIDINEFAQVLMEHQSNFMLHSDVTPEDREEIKRVLAPIIYRTVPVAPSKTVTEEWSNYAFNLCREVILNTDDYEKSESLRELRSGLLNLQRILSANADSDYGQEYQFATLQTIAAYQFHVPLTRLASYQKLIALQVNIGEHGILTHDSILGYCGADNDVVPYTLAHVMPYVLAVAAILKGHHNLWIAQCELLGRALNAHTCAHSLGSVIVRHYFFQCLYNNAERPATFSMPDGEFFSRFLTENDYAKILHYALLDVEIDQLVSADASRIWQMLELLVTDRAAVLARVREVSPSRGAEIEALLPAHGGELPNGVGHVLWPKLRRIVACGTGVHASAREKVREFFGRDIVWNNGTVVRPELLLARAVADECDEYVFDGTGCFCEFFQNDTDEISKPVSQCALQAGHTYNVIVTNGAGLYRVVTDNEIRVVRIDGDQIIVELS